MEISPPQDKPEKKVSKFKAKLIERQKAALAKNKNNVNVDEILNISQEINPPFSKFQKLTSCPQSAIISYLVKKYIKVSELVENLDRCIFPKFPRYFSIPLAYIPYQEETIEINKYLNEVHFIPEKPQIRFFENSLIENKKIDRMMTLILLKAHFGEVVIKDVINYVNRKRSHAEIESPEVEKGVQDKGSKRIGFGKLNFMGDDPQVVFENRESDLHVIIYVSTPPDEVNYDTEYLRRIDMSERLINRCQLILDHINDKKIQDDFFKLVRHVMLEEARLGKYIICFVSIVNFFSEKLNQ